MGPVFTIENFLKTGRVNEVLRILRAADLGIDGIDIRERENGDDPEIDAVLKRWARAISNINAESDAVRISFDHRDKVTSSMKIVEVIISHKGRDGQYIPFNLHDESDGTKVLLAFAGPLLDTLENGYTLFADELHRSLHPHALQFLVSLFLDPEINTGNAQLVFTSHETSVMARNFLHRDQIWLMDKENGATRLFPLSDFKVREYESFQKAYLDRRFGAVPRIRDFKHVEA